MNTRFLNDKDISLGNAKFPSNNEPKFPAQLAVARNLIRYSSDLSKAPRDFKDVAGKEIGELVVIADKIFQAAKFGYIDRSRY